MQKNKIIFMLVLSACLHSVRAEQAIGLLDVLSSVQKHHPEIKMQKNRLLQAQAQVLSERSAFDAKLKLEGNVTTDDVYDGDYYKAQLEQAIPLAGLKAFGGYRQSSGDFPSYEGKLETLDAGEYFLGVKWSFMQTFARDARQLKILQASLAQNHEQQSIREVILNLQKTAAQVYFSWRNSIAVQGVYQKMYDLAKDRQGALQLRVKKGDLPQVYILENERYLLERQRQLMASRLTTNKLKLYLNLFLREENGEASFVQKQGVVPQNDSWNVGAQALDEKAMLATFPKLKMLDYQKKIIDSEMRNLKINRLPDFKLKTQYSRDVGQGSNTLAGPELDVFASMGVSLQNRKARAELSKAKAKLRNIKHKYQLEQDKLKLALKQLENQLGLTQKMQKNLNTEVRIAEKMVEVEKTKWKNGDSDFILVNLREQDQAKVEVESLKASLSLEKIWSEYMYLTTRFESLLLKTSLSRGSSN